MRILNPYPQFWAFCTKCTKSCSSFSLVALNEPFTYECFDCAGNTDQVAAQRAHNATFTAPRPSAVREAGTRLALA